MLRKSLVITLSQVVLVLFISYFSVTAVRAAPLPVIPTATFTVTSPADNPDANPGDGGCADSFGNCTLRAAVEEANANGPGIDVVNLDAGTYHVGTVLNVTSNIRINGTNQASRIIDADSSTQIFAVSAAGALTIDDVTLREGIASFSAGLAGAAIYTAGSVTLTDCTIQKNQTNNLVNAFDEFFPVAGGAIYLANGASLDITNCTFSENLARVYFLTGPQQNTMASGGAIYNDGGTVTIDNSNFISNTASVRYSNQARGGAIFNNSGVTTITGTIFRGNLGVTYITSNEGLGGAIFNNTGGTLSITASSVLDKNEAQGAPSAGGALYNLGSLTLEDSTISQNRIDTSLAISEGGGLYNAGTMDLDNISFTGNVNEDGDGRGGALFNAGTGGVIDNSYFFANHSNGGGGAIYNNMDFITETMTIQFTDIISNYAHYSGGGVSNNQGTINFFETNFSSNKANTLTGGALFNNGNGRIVLDSSDIILNQAGYRGGAFGQYGQITVLNSRVANNMADEGGAIYASGMTLLFNRSTIQSNSASVHGGGVFVDSGGSSGSLDFVNSTISDNRANQNGGGFYQKGLDIRLSNVTVAHNIADFDGGNDGQGGGIYVANGVVRLQNSIVAANEDLSTGTFPLYAPDCSGTFTSDGYNLIGVDNGFCTISGTTTGNVIGFDPLLDALSGGPPAYHLLLAGSPAINAGNPVACTDPDGVTLLGDQRLETRPLGGRCDMGAIELFCTDGTAVAPILTTSRDGNHVVLNWTSHPENANHAVWQLKDDPYFVAGTGGSTLIGGGVGTVFTETNGLSLVGDAWYYVVDPKNDCNISGPDSNHGGVFRFAIQPGG